MRHCATCDHELGDDRYCTACGRPATPGIEWRTDTAERPRATPPQAAVVPPSPQPASPQQASEQQATEEPVPPARAPETPPPAWSPPTPVRYPLFADEVTDATAVDLPRVDPAQPPAAAPAAAGASEPAFEPAAFDPGAFEPAAFEPGTVDPTTSEPGHRAPSHARRPWPLWAAAGSVLALVAVIATLLVTSGDADGERGTAEGTREEPSGSTGPGGDSGVGDLVRDADVTVPATAPPGRDVDGQPVTYDADHMLDGVPETAWRMPGDGSGTEIVLRLPEESRLHSVGLINGYAKQATGRDWYHGNRRVEQVEWVFDDGTTVAQTLEDTTGVQSVDVDVTTATVTLRLVRVSAPGKGPSARDFTAISDVSVVGGVG